MTVEIVLADELGAEVPDASHWEKFASSVLSDLGFDERAELTVHFVGTDEIARLNEEYLRHEGPTDVLSFPVEDDPTAPQSQIVTGDDVPLLLGDVVICADVAARQAIEHETTTRDEIALLIVHGILHLVGMDHEDDGEAEEMEQKEREILAQLLGAK